jgi:hypothetical protein
MKIFRFDAFWTNGHSRGENLKRDLEKDFAVLP